MLHQDKEEVLYNIGKSSTMFLLMFEPSDIHFEEVPQPLASPRTTSHSPSVRHTVLAQAQTSAKAGRMEMYEVSALPVFSTTTPLIRGDI